MSRLIFLMLLAFPLVFCQIGKCPLVNEEFLKGLEQFGEAAEKQMTGKPIPDKNHWKFQRNETINKLKDLRMKLDNVCFYLSWAKYQDAGYSLWCRLAALAEFLLRYLPVNIESFMCPAETFRKEASSIMEEVSSQNYQNDLQYILIKEREISISMNEWLLLSQELEVEIQHIFGFNLKSKSSLCFVLLDEFYKLLTFTKTFNEAFELMKRSKYSKFLTEDITRNDLLKFSKYFKDYPILSKRIKLSLSVLSTLVSFSKSKFEIYRNSRNEKISQMIPFMWNKLGIKILLELKSSDFISAIVLDIVKEVTSFKNNINIVADDDCPYSTSLKFIIDILELELTFMQTSFID